MGRPENRFGMGTLAVKPDRLTKYKGLREDKPRESGGIPPGPDNLYVRFAGHSRSCQRLRFI